MTGIPRVQHQQAPDGPEQPASRVVDFSRDSVQKRKRRDAGNTAAPVFVQLAGSSPGRWGNCNPLLPEIDPARKGERMLCSAEARMTAPTPLTPDTLAVAVSLARPIVRGWMSHGHAQAAIMLSLWDNDLDATFRRFRFHRHLLDQEIHRLEAARDLADYRIGRTVWRLAGIGKPSNAIMAEAHNINGAAGFPLTEDEVADIVALTINNRRKGARKRG